MKKALIGLVVILGMVLLGAWIWLSSRLDESSVRTFLAESVKEMTGKELLIDGGISVSSFPSPKVVIAGAGIRNSAQASTEYLLQANRIEITLSLASVISGNPQISSVTLVRPVLELESLRDGSNNWALSPGEGATSAFSVSALTIQEGELHYRNEATRFFRSAENINGTLGWDASGIRSSMNFEYRKRSMQAEVEFGGLSFSSSTPVTLSLTHLESVFTFSGNAEEKNGKLLWQGKGKLHSADVEALLSGISDAAPEAEATKPAAQELTIEGDMDYNGDHITARQITLKGTGTSGQGQMVARLAAVPQVNLALAFEQMNLDPLLPLFSLSDLEKDNGSANDPYAESLAQQGSKKQSITRNLSLQLQLTAKKLHYNAQPLENVSLQAHLEDGEVEVQQVRGTLPGQTNFLMIGFVRDTFRGPAFEGSLEAQGIDIRKALAVLGLGENTLPKEDFGRFRGKSKLVMTPREMHLSEFDVQIERMRAVGNLFTSFGEIPKTKGVLQLVGLDLDRLAMPLMLPADRDYGWLKRFPIELNLNAAMSQYKLRNKQRDVVQFTLNIQPGKAGLEEVKTQYNGSTILGGISLDVTQALPLLSVKLKTDRFDPAAFFEYDFSAFTSLNSGASREGRWSKTEFDFSYLEGWSGDFDLSFDSFIHEDYDLQEVSVKGKLRDRELTLESMKGKLGGAEIDGKIRVAGGKSPALGIAFSASNVSIEKLRPYLPLLHSIKGLVSISGQVTTSGVNMYSWIAGLQGTISFVGSQVIAEGFNLSAIIRSVVAVRSASDIVVTVRNAYPNGKTSFDQVKGSLNLEGGRIRSPGIQISAEQTQGSIVGEIDLIKWAMKLFVNLNLTALDRAKPPVLSVSYTESLDAPKLDFDTTQLEWYVDQKTRSRLLEQGAPEPP